MVDCGVALLFLAAAAWLGHGLWPDPGTRELALNPTDQVLIEWFLAADTRVLLGEHGLVTDRLNAPDGVNLLANASSLTLGILLAPVTLALGAPVSFALLTIGNLAGTATGWYLLFARTLGARRAAAAVGGGLCGFAPAMISHSNSHWHMTAQWLVPAIAWSVVRLARAAAAGQPRRIATSGLWLAGLVVAQFFLGAELLYLTAITMIPLTIGYAVRRRDWARRVVPGFAAGLGIAVGAATLLLAYPLWVQLAGPGSVPNGPFDPHYFSADLASWPAFSPLAVAGAERAAALASGPAEYNTFLGLPLLLVALGCGVWLRRQPLAVAATVAAGVMGLLSLGPELVVNRVRTGFPLPYTVLVDVPVIDGALPQRYAVAVVPLVALLLVLALDRALQQPVGLPRWAPPLPTGPARWALPVAAGLALLPLVPAPLPAADRAPVPAFITGGHWRDCVEPGGVLVPVPLPTPAAPEPMRWAAAANAGFAVPEGFFIGPYARGGRASMGTAPRPTSQLLAEVAGSGEAAPVEPGHRHQAARDLAYWRAECVVLDPAHLHHQPLLTTLAELLGPGEQIAGAWVWRV
ncbi:MAG: hypothetical protein GEV12_05880 [Micromonosporaceae bacterium]|nr:hypothetical protein [Micromonosporaceae bacterium]